MKNITLFILCFSTRLFSQTEEQVLFKHNILGFEMSYPKSWTTNSVDDYYANLDRVKLKDGEFDEMLKKSASAPFISLTKYKEPYEDINPSLKINTKPYGALKGKTVVELINFLLPQFQRMFTDLSIQTEPTEILLNNNKAGYVKFFYTLKTKEGAEYKICSELYLIDKGNYFYMIGAGTKQDESNGKRSEILDIIKTINVN